MICPRCEGTISNNVIHDVFVCYVCKVGWSGLTLRNATKSKGLLEIKGRTLVKILVSSGIPQSVAEDLLKEEKKDG